MILSGIGLTLSGAALLIMVLRQTSPVAVDSRHNSTVPIEMRLAGAIEQMVREPAVTEHLRKQVIQWVEGEQLHRVQQEVASYVKSDAFHRNMLDSFRRMQSESTSASR